MRNYYVNIRIKNNMWMCSLIITLRVSLESEVTSIIEESYSRFQYRRTRTSPDSWESRSQYRRHRRRAPCYAKPHRVIPHQTLRSRSSPFCQVSRFAAAGIAFRFCDRGIFSRMCRHDYSCRRLATSQPKGESAALGSLKKLTNHRRRWGE